MSSLRTDAEQIWRAGVAAVTPERLVPLHVRVEGGWLLVDDEAIDLTRVERIAIVGAGKAAGAMAVALEKALGPQLLAEKSVTGWVNVPDNCLEPTQRATLHAGRPAGVNEPRPEGVAGTQRILEIVSALGPNDICFCLLTGGGSALLPAPWPGVTLEQKIYLTQQLSAAGANIEQLNTVRRHLSLIKGGGLARACRAGRLMTLAISDVPGDSRKMIASGPTVTGTTTSADALSVIESLGLADDPQIQPIAEFLSTHTPSQPPALPAGSFPACRTSYHVLANNATAVDAAGVEAERLGYSHAMISAHKPEGSAELIGRHLASMALRMRQEPGPDCLISGGEPVVTLVEPSRRGQGGRNQQLALAALAELGDCEGIVLLAAGTDGEDGPTDAAGAFVTAEAINSARSQHLDAPDYLARNDAYRFFEQAGGLLITGPTHTNVCDLRIVLVRR